MADEPSQNTVTPATRAKVGAAGDVPEHLRRRYYVDGRGGGGLGFYADAKVTAPAFRDHGGKLTASRTDPNVVRDLAAIAKHRGWAIVTVKGEADFRREAWIAGRALGLEVRGYRPTERDLQELERRSRTRSQDRDRDGPSELQASRSPEAPRREDAEARRTQQMVEAVVRARIDRPEVRDQILAGARERIAGWLERGARFRTIDLGAERGQGRQKERARSR